MKKIIFCLFFTAGLCFYAPLFAEQTPLNEINPIPRLKSSDSYQKTVVGEYHGRGVIDAVEGTEIVVNDSLFTLSENLEVMRVDGSPSTQSQLLPGTAIFYHLNGPKQIKTIFIDR